MMENPKIIKNNVKQARDPETSKEKLEQLSDDPDWLVRVYVALNKKTPQKILIKLSNDKIWSVRYRVALNPNTPKKILRRLAKDYNYLVKESIAMNPNTPEEILKEMATDISLNKDSLIKNISENTNISKFKKQEIYDIIEDTRKLYRYLK